MIVTVLHAISKWFFSLLLLVIPVVWLTLWITSVSSYWGLFTIATSIQWVLISGYASLLILRGLGISDRLFASDRLSRWALVSLIYVGLSVPTSLMPFWMDPGIGTIVLFSAALSMLAIHVFVLAPAVAILHGSSPIDTFTRSAVALFSNARQLGLLVLVALLSSIVAVSVVLLVRNAPGVPWLSARLLIMTLAWAISILPVVVLASLIAARFGGLDIDAIRPHSSPDSIRVISGVLVPPVIIAGVHFAMLGLVPVSIQAAYMFLDMTRVDIAVVFVPSSVFDLVLFGVLCFVLGSLTYRLVRSLPAAFLAGGLYCLLVLTSSLGSVLFDSAYTLALFVATLLLYGLGTLLGALSFRALQNVRQGNRYVG